MTRLLALLASALVLLAPARAAVLTADFEVDLGILALFGQSFDLSNTQVSFVADTDATVTDGLATATGVSGALVLLGTEYAFDAGALTFGLDGTGLTLEVDATEPPLPAGIAHLVFALSGGAATPGLDLFGAFLAAASATDVDLRFSQGGGVVDLNGTVTSANATAVPVPAAGAVFLTGLLGLGAARRRA